MVGKPESRWASSGSKTNPFWKIQADRPTGNSLLCCGSERLKLDVTFMSAGLEFVSVDGWGSLPRWNGPASHVPFETGGGEDKDQADTVRTDVLEAHPSLSRKKDRASGMHVVFLVIQSDMCGARLD